MSEMLDDLNQVVSLKTRPIAQSVEQRTFNPRVDGSSPSGPTLPIHASPDSLSVNGHV
jgi:hypothetical protein